MRPDSSKNGSLAHDSIAMLPLSETDEIRPGIRYTAAFLAPADADAYFARLSESLDWQQDTVTVYGKQHRIPRLHQWYGDAGCAYRWSGIEMHPHAWTPELAELRDLLSATAGCAFNTVLANLYRDGQDSMGWHADNEKELGAAPVIASLSLGATRDFHLRRTTGEGGTLSLPLAHGSLLVMSGNSQHEWQHALPKRKRVSTPRINLTFRRIVLPDADG